MNLTSIIMSILEGKMVEGGGHVSNQPGFLLSMEGAGKAVTEYEQGPVGRETGFGSSLDR